MLFDYPSLRLFTFINFAFVLDAEKVESHVRSDLLHDVFHQEQVVDHRDCEKAKVSAFCRLTTQDTCAVQVHQYEERERFHEYPVVFGACCRVQVEDRGHVSQVEAAEDEEECKEEILDSGK